MPMDVERMLRRAVQDVFGPDVDAVWDTHPRAPHIHRVALTAERGAELRRVGLRAATTGFFDLTVFDLDVSTGFFEYDDEDYMAALIRQLALVAEAYLRGEGSLVHERGFLRTRTFLTITVGGNDWKMGRRSSRPHYPEDDSAGCGGT